MASIANPATEFGARLREMADALGIEVNQFYIEHADPSLNDLLTVIRAYAAISDMPGKQRLLTVARREAMRCQNVFNLYERDC